MKERVTVAIAPLRKEPTDRSEMVSQGLMGEGLSVLERQEKWSMVRMDADGYEGWIDTKQIGSLDAESSLSMLTAPITLCFRPGGESIWLPSCSWVHSGWKSQQEQPVWRGDLPSIELAARSFLNAPYLWGGRTVMGIDCSGLTQLVMRLNGIVIPRDAYQQAEIGQTISFIEETQTGDLAFFDNADGRITHVGIVVHGGGDAVRIIHASGHVREDVLDHQGIFNRDTASYSHKLRIVKRIVS